MLFIDPRCDTTIGRATLALVCGALAATVWSVLWTTAAINLSSGRNAVDTSSGLLAYIGVSGMLWLFGLFTVGAAGWAILHRMSARGPASAILFGTALPGGTVALMIGAPAIWIPFATAGGVAGLVIWAVAYRRKPLVPHHPADLGA